ncbi:MAG: pyruvate formate-lyase-activating protein [Rikenellaceae bacterium]
MLRVHSYESMGTVDGPGLRFVIFVQGCNFRCLYCANVDTIEIGVGEEISEDKIFEMVSDMKPFFGKRGGVTLSGGEPSLQAKALIPLFERFKKAGIHTCLDTNGAVWNKDVEALLQLTDLVLLDVKQIDNLKHKSLTGHSNERTLKTAQWLEENNKPFWLRYVLVPGYSDSEDDVRGLGEALGGNKMLERVEILPYHRLGTHKYEEMGLDYQLKEVELCSDEVLSCTEKIFGEYFADVVI